MFKEKFEELLINTKTTIYQLSKATNLSTGQLGDYKSGRSSPKIDACIKIADYFGISIDELVGHVVLDKKEEELLSKQEETLLNLFRNTTEEKRLEMIAVFISIYERKD